MNPLDHIYIYVMKEYAVGLNQPHFYSLRALQIDEFMKVTHSFNLVKFPLA
jgi:hypothetical protein